MSTPITYTWEVVSIQRGYKKDSTYTIFRIHWTCTGTDEVGHTGIFFGNTEFVTPHPVATIPYEELTNEIVIEWVKAKVSMSYKQIMEKKIEEQIIAQQPV